MAVVPGFGPGIVATGPQHEQHQQHQQHQHAAHSLSHDHQVPTEQMQSYMPFAEEPSPPYTSLSSNSAYTAASETFKVQPAPDGRQKASPAAVAANENAVADINSAGGLATLLATGPGPPAAATPAAAIKSKRVRTGCLTCRERHLKCDEGLPDCVNCRKSNRECKRGVRLNFIDVQVKSPPFLLPTTEWSVQFYDESRQIASEYQGGSARYAPFDEQAITPPQELDIEVPSALPQQQLQQQQSQHQSPQQVMPNDPVGSMANALQVIPMHAGPAMYFQNDNTKLMQTTSPHAFGSMIPDGKAFMNRVSQVQPLVPASAASTMSFLPPTQELVSRNHTHRASDGSTASSSLISHAAAQAPPSYSDDFSSAQSFAASDRLVTPPVDPASSGNAEYLESPEEIYYMQIFVSEVGVWMDSIDHEKHFSRIIPYLALQSDMLKNAFLACGVMHMTLTNTDGNDDEKALFYYDTATTQLLRNLQNPDRNMAECATTAVVLNVYEVMSEKMMRRMSHIAGARALIRECGWNAKSPGIGGACFWLNIGMELYSCLAFNWRTAWDPDQWGMDLEFTNLPDSEEEVTGFPSGAGKGSHGLDLGHDGEEDLWVHRMWYIAAKIVNFRANIPRFQDPSPHDEQVRLQNRFAEWKRLKNLCDWWNNSCPRSMRPFAYIKKGQRSLFPNIWLIKRAAVVGRLHYHTAMCLLAQINPLSPRDSQDNVLVQQHHAHQVCGIVAHTTDRGVSAVSIRSTAIVAAVLSDHAEQEEVLQVLDRVSRETGWRLGSVVDGLKKGWGWDGPPAATTIMAAPPPPQVSANPAPQSTLAPSAPAAPARRPVNPLLVQADFSLPNHPYQNWYEPPNRTNTMTPAGSWHGQV